MGGKDEIVKYNVGSQQILLSVYFPLAAPTAGLASGNASS